MNIFMGYQHEATKTKAPEGALLLFPEGSTSTAHGPCQLAANTAAHFVEAFAQISAGRTQSKGSADQIGTAQDQHGQINGRGACQGDAQYDPEENFASKNLHENFKANGGDCTSDTAARIPLVDNGLKHPVHDG